MTLRFIARSAALWVFIFCISVLGKAQSVATPPTIDDELNISAQKIFTNMANSTTPGALMASPSTSAPNYYYHWTRDAALTHKSLFQLFNSTQDQDLKQKIEASFKDWVGFETFAQTQAEKQPAGLGEPRFFLNGLVDTAPWGRPQNDGPATRALTMSLWALQLLDGPESAYVNENLYRVESPATSPIKKDLDFVAKHWNEACIDLWEEVRGFHFYTLAMQRKSLLVGAELADKMDDPDAATYRQEAENIRVKLQSFLNTGKPYIVATLDVEGIDKGKVSGLDIAVILAALHGLWDDNFFLDNQPFFTNTLDALESKFQEIYPGVNSESDAKLGTAMGRYPEDVYDGSGFSGANPWFISTHATAEFYCRMAALQSNPDTAKTLKNKGLSFLNRSLKHRNQEDGSMSEQYSRFNGYLDGARDLTWSYASFITAYEACK